MAATTTPNPSLADLITRILVLATHILRDLHVRASTTTILKTVLATHQAAARIGRAVRLATLLLRRIHDTGLRPLAPARPRPAPAAQPTIPPVRNPRPQADPPFHTGNADAAFVRRPIPVIVAAITRELHLAALAMGMPLPEALQDLCLRAALASTGAAEAPAPTEPAPKTPAPQNPTPAAPQPTQDTPIPPNQTAPTPTKTLEL